MNQDELEELIKKPEYSYKTYVLSVIKEFLKSFSLITTMTFVLINICIVAWGFLDKISVSRGNATELIGIYRTWFHVATPIVIIGVIIFISIKKGE